MDRVNLSYIWMGKEELFKYFRNNFPHKTECIEIEHYIKATKQIADIYIRSNNGNEWVVEYQRSNVQLKKKSNRKYLYNQAGIKDIWIAGENLISKVTYCLQCVRCGTRPNL